MTCGDQWREGMRDEVVKANSAEITEITKMSTKLEIEISYDDHGKKDYI